MRPTLRPLRTLALLASLSSALFSTRARADAAVRPVPPAAELAFSVAGDMRQFVHGTPDRRLFDGACEAMKRVGPGAFLITPGDFDPPAPIREVLNRTLGETFPWYVVVGNHEVETGADVQWVKGWASGGIPHLVRQGPPGLEYAMYSFDYANSHFVAIDTYPEPKEGNKGPVDVTEAMFSWLEADLAATRQPLLWVIGHQPIESQPDMDTGRMRHNHESVSSDAARKERFIQLLRQHQVRGYICGHTHDVSVVRVNGGIWQADSGHARGAGDVGAPSSFLKFRIQGERAWVDVYRTTDATGREYALRKTVELVR